MGKNSKALEGGDIWMSFYIYIMMADLNCKVKTNSTLQSKYPPIKKHTLIGIPGGPLCSGQESACSNPSLFLEDSKCQGAAKPICQLQSLSSRGCAPQLLSLCAQSQCITKREATAVRSPCIATKSSPCSSNPCLLQWKKACAKQQRPHTAKNT